MKYLVQDGSRIKKATMEGLEEVKEGSPNEDDFNNHGTEHLGDIIGNLDKIVSMSYMDNLGDYNVFSYKLVGYKDVKLISN